MHAYCGCHSYFALCSGFEFPSVKMVAAFLLCSLSPPCEVLHAVPYAPLVLGADGAQSSIPVKKKAATGNGSTVKDDEAPGEDTRVRNARHAMFDSLAERVLSECSFRMEMDKPASISDSARSSGPDAPSESSGVFRSRKGSPFMQDYIVHWKRHTNLVLVLMRTQRENPVAVDMALDTISRALLLLCKRADKSPADLILTPEEITAVLHTHLPHGIVRRPSQHTRTCMHALPSVCTRCMYGPKLGCA
eukprot:m.149574 g.149574  ORF g.149574 m.149574 type:complete len:248 (-) comp17823_c0_seq1:132-875(-)